MGRILDYKDTKKIYPNEFKYFILYMKYGYDNYL